MTFRATFGELRAVFLFSAYLEATASGVMVIPYDYYNRHGLLDTTALLFGLISLFIFGPTLSGVRVFPLRTLYRNACETTFHVQ